MNLINYYSKNRIFLLKEYRREIDELMSELQQQQQKQGHQQQQRMDPMENTTSDCIIDTSIVDTEMNAAVDEENNKHTDVGCEHNNRPGFNLETLVRLMKIYLALRHTIYSGCKFN